jgi:alanine racemase
VSSLIRALISGSALRANLKVLRQRAPGARIMAVVKANAYGHGLVPTALALPDADAFAVARLGEAIALREAGVAQPIVLLEGVFDAAQLAIAARLSFDLVVHHPDQLALLEQQAARDFVVWLKVDSGMNRLGFRMESASEALARLRALRPALREVRLLTHLACADEPGSPATARQLQRFAPLAADAGLICSIANSAALLSVPEAQADWVRPGIALYGASPFASVSAASLGLVPAMSLETTVIATRHVPAGETVGYANTWRAERDTQVAILAAGYGDGLPRSLANGSPVLVGTQRASLVGRVSMDMIAVDVTGRADVRVGDGAVLWGPGLPVEEIAACAATIPYELLCGVSQRVPLTFI